MEAFPKPCTYRSFFFLSLFVALLSGMLCQEEDCKGVGVVATEAGATTFLQGLSAAGVLDTLKKPDTKRTFLVPSNQGFVHMFDALGITSSQILSDVRLLQETYLYHTLPMPMLAADFQDGDIFRTGVPWTKCNETSLKFRVDGDSLEIQGGVSSAKVIIPDLDSCGSILHIIDNVLFPCNVTIGGTDLLPTVNSTSSADGSPQQTLAG